jgi:ABC-type transport system involved in multi-copper enzyme maturation permease subunit
MMHPVIQREFFGILRSRKAIAMLVALAVAISLVVLVRWPTDEVVDALGKRTQQVFRVFGYVLLTSIMFLVPAFPATSIVRERNRGTLALLLNSPLSSWSIFWGKVCGSLLFASLLLISTLPAAGACYAMGGVDPVDHLGSRTVLPDARATGLGQRTGSLAPFAIPCPDYDADRW